MPTPLRREEELLQDFFWMLLLTGARRGNVLAMRWDEIDLKLKFWRISTAKNGDSQYIALTPASITLLTRRMEHADGSPWVFPGEGISGHLADPKRAFKRILARAQLKDLRIHDLRRTVGSYLAINGANSFLIGQALGHKDPRSTIIYAKLNLDPIRHAVETIQADFFGL